MAALGQKRGEALGGLRKGVRPGDTDGVEAVRARLCGQRVLERRGR
jgi:hypothetical protein